MNTNIAQNTEGAFHARQMVRWSAMGIVPSQANAIKAQLALKDFAVEGDFNPAKSIRLTGAIGMGVLPSVLNCREAEGEINQVIDSMREVDRNTLRENYRHRN